MAQKHSPMLQSGKNLNPIETFLSPLQQKCARIQYQIFRNFPIIFLQFFCSFSEQDKKPPGVFIQTAVCKKKACKIVHIGKPGHICISKQRSYET